MNAVLTLEIILQFRQYMIPYLPRVSPLGYTCSTHLMQVKCELHAHNPLVYITKKHITNYNIMLSRQAFLLFYFIQTQNIVGFFFKGLIAFEISGPYSNLLNTCTAKSECMFENTPTNSFYIFRQKEHLLPFISHKIPFTS